MKTVARELMWLLIALLLAIPIGYLFGTILELQPESDTATTIEAVFEMELFIIGAIIGFALTYVMRVFMWAITKQLANTKS